MVLLFRERIPMLRTSHSLSMLLAAVLLGQALVPCCVGHEYRFSAGPSEDLPARCECCHVGVPLRQHAESETPHRRPPSQTPHCPFCTKQTLSAAARTERIDQHDNDSGALITELPVWSLKFDPPQTFCVPRNGTAHATWAKGPLYLRL